MPAFTQKEMALVLAALHAYMNLQEHDPLAPEIAEIATCGHMYPLPTHTEIAALIERFEN